MTAPSSSNKLHGWVGILSQILSIVFQHKWINNSFSSLAIEINELAVALNSEMAKFANGPVIQSSKNVDGINASLKVSFQIGENRQCSCKCDSVQVRQSAS